MAFETHHSQAKFLLFSVLLLALRGQCGSLHYLNHIHTTNRIGIPRTNKKEVLVFSFRLFINVVVESNHMFLRDV